MEYYKELIRELRKSSRSLIYSDGVRKKFGEAADALEDLVARIEGANQVLDRIEGRLKDINVRLKDAVEANEEIRNG